MTNERFEKIKENAHTRCKIANYSGIGLTSSDKEELELIEEVDRLNNIINELEKYLRDKTRKVLFDNNGIKEIYADIYLKIKELKGEKRELVTLLTNTGCMNIKTHKKLIELVSYFKLNEELKEDK